MAVFFLVGWCISSECAPMRIRTQIPLNRAPMLRESGTPAPPWTTTDFTNTCASYRGNNCRSGTTEPASRKGSIRRKLRPEVDSLELGARMSRLVATCEQAFDGEACGRLQALAWDRTCIRCRVQGSGQQRSWRPVVGNGLCLLRARRRVPTNPWRRSDWRSATCSAPTREGAWLGTSSRCWRRSSPDCWRADSRRPGRRSRLPTNG